MKFSTRNTVKLKLKVKKLEKAHKINHIQTPMLRYHYYRNIKKTVMDLILSHLNPVNEWETLCLEDRQ
jgi:hypothetical protein